MYKAQITFSFIPLSTKAGLGFGNTLREAKQAAMRDFNAQFGGVPEIIDEAGHFRAARLDIEVEDIGGDTSQPASEVFYRVEWDRHREAISKRKRRRQAEAQRHAEMESVMVLSMGEAEELAKAAGYEDRNVLETVYSFTQDAEIAVYENGDEPHFSRRAARRYAVEQGERRVVAHNLS